ncbi:hypothetical protein H2200_009121 [Cladophialophora chaetospira]|uniref:Pisatin demethylase n=1 Tax=Cladophialophora chaetospira TaxID=386627 RepID=A0AA39CFE6_9EURO|nr:hypothetical protein H2200_009121 [Cladophialophora chaetospira]
MDIVRCIFLLTLASLVYSLLWVVYTRVLHPLHGIPGPFWASVTRTWYTLASSKGDLEHVQRALHGKYGPLVRIAPNEVICADPEAIKTIYPIQAPIPTKTDFYDPWRVDAFSKHPDNFTASDEKVHGRRRRIVNHIYSLTNVLSLESYIDKCTKLFLQRLGEFADSGKAADLGEWLQWYSFDVIGELFFGRTFGFMQQSHDHEALIASLDAFLPVLSTVSVASSYYRPFMLISALLSSSRRKAVGVMTLFANTARRIVVQRREAETQEHADDKIRRDLLKQLLDIVRDKGEKVDFGFGDVAREAHIALFAGSDTTAIVLRSCFYYLMKSPEVHRQVVEELDQAASRNELSSPIQYGEASRLPLLGATIKEAMRLHPSVGFTLPRTVPAGGIEIAGTYIPAGWRVGMNAAVIGYNEEIFGRDALEFRPRRWLESDSAKMDKYMLVFGAGTRTCIGKNISLAEIYKLLPEVLRRFDVQLVDPAKEWKTHNFWFNKQTGIEVRIKRR